MSRTAVPPDGIHVAKTRPLAAHAQRQAGPIHMEIGFGTEPAYVGQPNSVQIILTERGKPVVDLGGSLKVQVSFGGQPTDLPLEANFEVGGDGTPGDYRAWFIPSQPGPYTFHFTGTVHGTKIDESLTSGPTTFVEVQDPAEAAFPPVTTPTTQELADRIEQHGEELIKLEALNVGKPYAVTMSEELPPIVDVREPEQIYRELRRLARDEPDRLRGPAGSGVRARTGHGPAGRRRAARGRPGERPGPDRGGVRHAGRRALMRIAIAGAGAVGRSIAGELLENGHEVLLIDNSPKSIKVDSVPRAEWLLADACEISSLDDAALQRCQVVIAATGDDKVNLVVSLLAKTEYGVPRVVARVNHPGNEWLYNESWGVDVAVSTPRLLSALVEEAVSVGDLVRLMTFGQSEASLVELTMPDDAPLVGQRVGGIEWPADTSLVAILREGRVLVPQPDDPLQAGDELFFVTSEDVEDELGRLLSSD